MTQIHNSPLIIHSSQSPSLTLYSTVLKLTPTTAGQIPTTQGRLIHGAFLELIRTIDPGLSAALHVENRRRPFTLSQLHGVGRARKGQVRVRAGQALWLRFTLLSSRLFTTFTRFLLDPPGGSLPVLRLGQIEFAISEMLTTPGSHPWAGYTTLDELSRKWQNGSPAEAVHKIEMDFASGLFFSRSSDKDGMGRFLEFYPSPEMLFGSLAARWGQLTGRPAPMDNRELRQYARETVVVSAFNFKTILCRYWGQPQIGGVGWIGYELRDRDCPELAGFFNLLADFAFYSGVGAKTAMGMGQVRRRTGGS